jgi:alkylresorcinol/alkylpyrone synthase
VSAPSSTSPAPSPAILAVGRALPPNHVDQETLTAALRAHWARQHFNAERLEELHRAVQVKGRHLALPLAEYPTLDTFKKSNDAWIRVAEELGAEAVLRALEAAGLRPADVDQLVFVTVTGLATPSIDARLVNRLGLRRDLKRVPIFGLGCVAGASGLARLSDLLAGSPEGVGVLLSVELCSLTLQREDLSVANAVASGIFGDGAAAVVLVGGARVVNGGPVPRVVATRAAFYPDTEWVMGWDFRDTGFQVVLSAEVPRITRENIGRDVDGFLASQGLRREDVRHWIAHTGGPRVLEAFQSALGLPDGALRRSWTSLEEVGNLSSASVLFVLGDLLESGEPRPGDLGLVVAMGPGFCAEMVLLRW